MPGYDPILDGSAAPADEFKLTVFKEPDGGRTIEVTFPDGSLGIYDSMLALAQAMADWTKEHKLGDSNVDS